MSETKQAGHDAVAGPVEPTVMRRLGAERTTMETPKPMPGTWTLTAPDGRTWQADSPLRCVSVEQRERVPADVALARVVEMANEPDFAERHVQLGRFYAAANTDALIDAMEAHILRLQEKVAMMMLPQPCARPQHVREG